MTKIAIVYHSGFGHTEVLAKALLDGVNDSADAIGKLFRAEDMVNRAEELSDFDAIVFGAPTYMGSASAPMKQFMDTTQKVWMVQGWKDKIAAGFTNSAGMSGDKFNTMMQFATFAAQHGMIWVSLGMHNESSFAEDTYSGAPHTINRVGSYLGMMAQSDNAPAEITPPDGDKKTAFLFGKRIADVTRKWTQ